MAVLGLAQALALELAPEILVNAIAPGPILAPADLSDEEDAEVRRATPLGRWGGPEEIAKTALFLIETDFVTGECIRVDGGRRVGSDSALAETTSPTESRRPRGRRSRRS